MNNKNVRGIIALVVVTALSFGIILGSKALSTDNGQAAEKEQAKVVAELDVNGAEGVDKAVKTEDGYMVTVRTAGYVGDVVMNVSFAEDAQTITGVEVIGQNETPDLGARIEEPEFLSRFEGAAAPVYLPGMTFEAVADDAAEENTAVEELVLNDGNYEAKTAEADSNGFIDVVNVTVADGKITEVVWECVDEEGNKKSVLSETGVYVMTDDGLTWAAQAEALGAAVVASQSTAGLGMNEAGKTDVVSGVSIYIGGFVNLVEQCLAEAAGQEVNTEAAAPQNGTLVDGISGATFSSKAVINGINIAYNFLQSVK